MSKKVEERIVCPNCSHAFKFTLYRSIWGEHESNRALVFSDQINVASCPFCKKKFKVSRSLLFTNVEKNIAVWWEPSYDPQIDEDARGYAKMFGEGNYYHTAPRIREWEEFKRTILKFEAGEVKRNPVKVSPELNELAKGFLNHIMQGSKKIDKNVEVHVKVEHGFWACPSCGSKNPEIYDACRDCSQFIKK